jgi:MocE subfamily Rieske [2Fe-2S] domain protein
VELRTLLPNYVHLFNGPKMIWRMIRHAAGSIDADAVSIVPEDELSRVVWDARIFVAILGGVVGWSVMAGSITPLLFVGLPSFYGVWLLWFFAITQHAGLPENVLDHRISTRNVYMNPVFRFLYLNMNYHLDHHLFPAVPYHALPALHEEIKDQLPAPNKSMLSAYREIVGARRMQRKDPTWEIPDRLIPAADPRSSTRTMRTEVGTAGVPGTVPGAVLAAEVALHATEEGSVDLGPADMVRPGEVTRIDLDGRTYALCRPTTDSYWLTDGICTHAQAHLAEGHLDGFNIECPKHNGRFDVRTGEPLRRPVKTPLGTYPVSAVDGRIRAKVPTGPDQELSNCNTSRTAG